LVENPKIRVIKLYGRFNKEAKSLGLLEWPVSTPEDPFENYGICSGHPMKELSPMLLGPVIIDGKIFAKNIEDGWQGSKVWSAHMTNGHFDPSKDTFWVSGNKKINPDSDDWIPEWEKWSQYIRMSGFGKRRHFKIDKSQTNPNVPLFQYFRGERLSYVEGRKKMYVRWYYELVQKTEAFLYLKERFEAGTSLNFLEFDGTPRDSAEILPEELSEKKLREMINDANVVFGHGFVLAAALLRCKPWEDEGEQEKINTETTNEDEKNKKGRKKRKNEETKPEKVKNKEKKEEDPDVEENEDEN